jgi:glycosyltransferase involved in cell wall biosynthesis
MKWTPEPQIVFSSGADGEPPRDLVSVCVTAYNYERFITDCLQSLFLQRHRNVELIVVDDASDRDQTLLTAKEWIEKSQHRFYRALLLTNMRNQGPSASRNSAFARASGDYVFILDADNEIYPRAISEMYSVAVEEAFDVVYSQLEFFGTEAHLGFADFYDSSRLKEGNYIDVMSMVSRRAWEKVGGFSHLELGWEDYDFWLKLDKAGCVMGYLPEILCRYRTHGQSRTDLDAAPSHEKLREIMALRHPA